MEAGETARAASPEPRQSGRSAIYSVELEVFEGPLDLLLHLVRRHELEILDIPIAFITEKYLAYLDLMRSLDLEVAGDYLVMAATLAWLKSRELLPSDKAPAEGGEAGEEEAEDPREALIRRLVEYERFKNAAADLDALPVSGRDVFARGADIDVPQSDPGLAPVTLFKLAEAYYRVLTRAKINKDHVVQLELVTVAQRMTQLTLMLDEKQAFDFEGLFLGRQWSSERELRTMLVVTLMSVLELVKLGVARVQQVQDSESIRIYRLEASEEARAQIEHYDESESFGDTGKPPPPPPPLPSESELDAAEESALLAEALAGADDTDLGPDAGVSPAANTPQPETDEKDAEPERREDTADDAAELEADDAAELEADDAEPESREDTADDAAELEADDAEPESREDTADDAAELEADALADDASEPEHLGLDKVDTDSQPGAESVEDDISEFESVAPESELVEGDVSIESDRTDARLVEDDISELESDAAEAESVEDDIARLETDRIDAEPLEDDTSELESEAADAEPLEDDVSRLASEAAEVEPREDDAPQLESDAAEVEPVDVSRLGSDKTNAEPVEAEASELDASEPGPTANDTSKLETHAAEAEPLEDDVPAPESTVHDTVTHEPAEPDESESSAPSTEPGPPAEPDQEDEA